MRVARVKVNHETDTLSLRHLTVALGSIPLLYFPYARVSRKETQESGFQSIQMDYHSRRGVSIGLPYQASIGSSVPLTFTVSYLSKRGPQLKLNMFKNPSQLAITWVPRDQQYDGRSSSQEIQRVDSKSFDPSNRWHLGVSHEDAYGPWTIKIALDQNSDVDYWRDFRSVRHGSGILANDSHATLMYLKDTVRARFTAQRISSTVIKDQYVARVPEIDLLFSPRWKWLYFESNANYAAYRSNSGLTSEILRSESELDRQYASQLVSVRRRLGAFGFDAQLGYSRASTRYRDEMNTLKDSRNQTHRSVLASIHFDRFVKNRVGEFRQTLEPKIYFVDLDYAEVQPIPYAFDDSKLSFNRQQLFSTKTNTGLHAIDGARKVTIGATTAIWRPSSSSKVASAAIGWIHHFEGISGNGNSAEQLGFEGQVKRGQFGLSVQHLISGTTNLPDESNLLLGYYDDARFVAELTYAQRAYVAMEQASANIQKRLNSNWFFFAHLIRNLDLDQDIDRFIGLSYDNCCFNLRLMYRQTIEVGLHLAEETSNFDRGISLQLVFKGLFTVGSRIDRVLQRKSLRGLY